MKLPRYELTAEKSMAVFEFTSEGHKGSIVKLIKYSETNLRDMYNLAFGDKNWVYATGSTKTRTRLYQMGIAKYFDEVSDNFKI